MPVIDNVISNQNFELIRNRIGEILADELANQYTLTANETLNADVYVERSVPLAWNQMPAVNVLLSRGPQGNEHQGHADGTYTFNIDCYAAARQTNTQAGDTLAATKVQQLVGVCRYILAYTAYKTLGFTRGFIGSTSVDDIQFEDPKDTQDSTFTAKGRIIFTVRANEITAMPAAMLIAGYDTVVKLGETDEGYRWSILNSLPAPFGLTATVDPYGILLLWNYQTGISELGFNIYRSVGEYGGEYELIGSTSAGVQMFIDETSPEGDVLFYYVTAFNAIRESSISNIVSAQICETPPITIFNDKTTPEALLSDITDDATLTAKASLEVVGGPFVDDISIPVPGTPLKFRIRDSVGGLFAMTLQPGPGYVESEDRIYIDYANILIRDEDNPSINVSVIPTSNFIVAIYDSTGTTRFVDGITGLAFTGSNHLRVWVDEDAIGANDPVIGFPLLKTGQADDFGVAGSDGDLQMGEDFFILRANNPFDHTRRFTGITGGYHNGTDWVDINGNVTTEALAFPESVVLDWHQNDRDASPKTVKAYFKDFLSLTTTNWGNHVTGAQAFSTASFATGWYLGNEKDGQLLINRASNVAGNALNYPPFNWPITGTSLFIWLGTQRGDVLSAGVPTQAVALNNTWFGIFTTAKSQNSRALYARVITYTELGL